METNPKIKSCTVINCPHCSKDIVVVQNIVAPETLECLTPSNAQENIEKVVKAINESDLPEDEKANYIKNIQSGNMVLDSTDTQAAIEQLTKK